MVIDLLHCDFTLLLFVIFFFHFIVYMPFNKFIEYIILLSLFIATLGTCYIFIVTIILKDNTYAGFYSTWQFPMLFAIFIDTAFYKHLSRLTIK